MPRLAIVQVAKENVPFVVCPKQKLTRIIKTRIKPFPTKSIKHNGMADETLLIERLKNPSTRERAFTQLIQQYQQSLYNVIRSILKSHADTDDVLQNTFLKAWGALDSFRGEAQISTWLYSIARNEAISFLKKKSRNVTSQDNEDLSRYQQESDPYIDGEETERMLQKAMGQLPEKQRTVFVLRYFQEMPYEEMSQMTSTSIGALKASYHFAVKKIIDFFQQND